ncbi:hypothetical protein HRbin23_01337 [bacterium HR23]|nr:hypothetical protein HRbin23_01337 [bacterium HR23]
MPGSEVFLLAVRWLHGLGALAWIGGNIFYFLVLRPRLGRPDTDAYAQAIAQGFRQVVHTATLLLVLTGIILTFERLTSPVATVPYVVVLGLKVSLALAMFLLVRRPPRAPPTPQKGLGRLLAGLQGGNLGVLLGILVYLLADLLKVLAELALKGR